MVAAILTVSGLLAGLCVGSFIAALTLRWPQGRAFVAGRSHCESCDRTLAPVELIPVASYLALGGKCRGCGAAIGRRQLAVEVAAGVVGAAALGLDPGLGGVAGALFGWTLLTLLVLDVEHFWLPDVLTLPLAAAGVAVAWLLDADVATSLIGCAAGYASLWLVAALYRYRTGRHGIGGGDPKLFAAIGAWLGWQALPSVLAVAALAGLVWLAFDRWRGVAVTARSRIAFGAVLAMSGWLYWLAAAGR